MAHVSEEFPTTNRDTAIPILPILPWPRGKQDWEGISPPPFSARMRIRRADSTGSLGCGPEEVHAEAVCQAQAQGDSSDSPHPRTGELCVWRPRTGAWWCLFLGVCGMVCNALALVFGEFFLVLLASCGPICSGSTWVAVDESSVKRALYFLGNLNPEEVQAKRSGPLVTAGMLVHVFPLSPSPFSVLCRSLSEPKGPARDLPRQRWDFTGWWRQVRAVDYQTSWRGVWQESLGHVFDLG